MATGLLLVVAALAVYAGYELRSPERRAAWWNGVLGTDQVNNQLPTLDGTPDAGMIGDAIESWHLDVPDGGDASSE